MEVCPLCFSNLKIDNTTVENVFENKKLSIKNVPTLTCFCGKKYFNTKIIKELNDLTLKFGSENKESEMFYK